MEYVKVESSQIDSVGFGEGVYGPETLGIRFKNKSGITEYAYQNVTARMYQALVAAESVGKYFGANIKNRPEFPYMKVETPDPQQPPTKNTVSPSSEATATTILSGLQSDLTKNMIEIPTDNPSTSLAIIDKLEPEFIFSPGKVDSIIVKLREQVLDMAKGLDPSTPAKQKRIRDIKGLVASQRIFVEKSRKGYVADLVAKKGLTDKVSSAVQGRLSDIEDEILKVTGYAAWEQGVKDRKAKNERTVLEINAMKPYVYPTIESLILAIAELNAIDTADMDEFKDLATGSKENQLKELTAELVKRQEAEKNAAELEALRAAEAKRQDDARIEAAVEAAKVEIRQEVIAELHQELMDGPGEDEFIEAQPSAREPEIIPFIYKQVAPDAPVVPFVDKQAIHAEIVESLQGCTLTRQQAISVLKAITEGRIPHVSITY